MARITETQLRSLCNDLYRDRAQIYEFNPSASHAEVLLWMVLGSLVSLLSLSDEEMPNISEPTETNYLDAICHLMDSRREGNFDVREVLSDLLKRSTDADNLSNESETY